MCNRFTNKRGQRDPIVTEEIEAGKTDVRVGVNNKINVLGQLRIRCAKAIDNGEPIPVFKNLYAIVSSLEVLSLAYSNIKSNSGAMTKGTVDNTADGISEKRLVKIAENLKNRSFRFPPVRRTWVPKPGKNLKSRAPGNQISLAQADR